MAGRSGACAGRAGPALGTARKPNDYCDDPCWGRWVMPQSKCGTGPRSSTSDEHSLRTLVRAPVLYAAAIRATPQPWIINLMSGRLLIQAVGLLLWAVAVAVVGVWIMYPRLSSGWAITFAQMLLYGVTVTPILIWSRNIFRLFASPPWQYITAAIIAGAALLAAGTTLHLGRGLIQAALRASATAIGEETVFRGFIWDRMRRSGWKIPMVIAVDTAAFATFHIPAMLSQFHPISFATLIIVGVLLSLLRLVTRGLLIPTAVHFALDFF